MPNCFSFVLSARDINLRVSADLTLREARDLFYKLHGFPVDGGISASKWSPFGCRDLKVYLPNFEWRRKAIPFHDLHHIIGEYEFSPTGEYQVAAWEFAAGKYPNVFTTLFCIPLVSIGALWIPKKQFYAFLRGRRSNTLYQSYSYNELLDRTVGDLRKEILPEGSISPTCQDFYEYSKIVFLSALVAVTPFMLLFVIYLGAK